MRTQCFCRCVLNLLASHILPMQNKNVKWPCPTYFGEHEPQWLTLSSYIKPEQVFRATGVLNRSLQLQHFKVKFRCTFYKASSLTSPSSLLKLPKYCTTSKKKNVTSEQNYSYCSIKVLYWRKVSNNVKLTAVAIDCSQSTGTSL